MLTANLSMCGEDSTVVIAVRKISLNAYKAFVTPQESTAWPLYDNIIIKHAHEGIEYHKASMRKKLFLN